MFILIIAAVALAGAASSQTVVTNPTTTTIWAGTADFSAFGLGSLTAPSSGVILSGTAINRAPVRGAPAASFFAETTAPGSALPVTSKTTPLIVPTSLPDCALATEPVNNTTAQKARA